jgi:hypothetical protein
VEAAVLAEKQRKLWLKVIQQAVAEAEGQQMYDLEEEEKPGAIRRARKFLCTCSRSLQTVGFLAGLNGEQIRLLVEMNRRKYGNNELSNNFQ